MAMPLRPVPAGAAGQVPQVIESGRFCSQPFELPGPAPLNVVKPVTIWLEISYSQFTTAWADAPPADMASMNPPPTDAAACGSAAAMRRRSVVARSRVWPIAVVLLCKAAGRGLMLGKGWVVALSERGAGVRAQAANMALRCFIRRCKFLLQAAPDCPAAAN